ncbi:hypothetical protein J7F03_19755 [Streptomyces sp. ISL-43]|uniref:hypothetical protein n=1 Tax=Streptomyces sp. ISL-43 TaxID=2819183 RepID=UPI001BE7A412|nr:hypothetical protein [Streptomyces sp. ISL-43]MBT2449288.1 hypothetical protein [Streptomyces sp. ISL-43]
MSIWMIGSKSRSVDKDSLRRLRLHLCRLHVEYECIRLILRDITAGRMEREGTQGLRIFLNRGIDLLSSPRKFGFDQDPILAAAYGAEEMMNQEERGTVLGMLSERRVSELRKIEEASGSSPIVTNIVNGDNVIVASGGLSMSDYRFHVGGDFNGVVGDRNVVKESFQAIDNSSGSAEVKDLLKQLTEAVALAASRMPREQAEQSLRDFDAFRDEALAIQPRKSMLEMLGGALAQTANIVGDIGAPVVTLVSAVIGLLA